jgi:hypothetical protein
MKMRAVACAWLSLVSVLIARPSVHGQEPGVLQPPISAVSSPEASPEASDKAMQKTLDDLLSRSDEVRRELRLLEAQLAVKRAEAQRAEAELHVFLLQHPDQDAAGQRAVDEAVRSDPDVASLRAQIESARHKADQATRMSRAPNDPSRRVAAQRLQALERDLKKRVDSRKREYLNRGLATRLSDEPSSAGTPLAIESTLDRLIGELENLRRALPRESQKP